MVNLNTVIDEPTLVKTVSGFYNLTGPISCKFIRRSFNDHYLIKAGTKQYVLRVYLNNKNYIHNIDEIKFELDYLQYLNSKGIPVMDPIISNNNKNFIALKMNDETRYLTLFPFASGFPIDENLYREQSNSLGQIIAKLHLCSNNFVSKYSRYHLDIKTLIEDPLSIIEKNTYLYGLGNISFFKNHTNKLIDYINNLPIDVNSYGLIHGDLNPSNLYFSNKNGFSLFDFDHCGYGYRIHDLAVIKLSFPDQVYKAILNGYEEIRPLYTVEKNCIEVYSDILLIKKFSDIYNMLEITGGNREQKKLITQNAYNTLKEFVSRSY
ncbi:phosphotransferase [Neobacillus kokaensis]|uniref:Aminoglycoside phosphotransferase domain-containing protein n=1 Tax=Neobacillus kokaensis TaxID=2759023 RepID=A0ABQ3N5Y1_9BACI|nr:phosphotransferase [Neobacillus kokaensis]GHH99456.1 hypothetical protein AM1BK_29990 [Neobacillus kokaensis]